MDFMWLFFLFLILGILIFLAPAFFSASQTRKEKKLIELEEQTKIENEKVILEINNILDNENDMRSKEQLDLHICCNCGYVNLISKNVCKKCSSELL